MVMPFVWEGEGAKPFFSLEVEKESISFVLEESIFLGKVSDDVEETESFVVVVVWETCVDEVEEQEKNVAFWRAVGRDFSSVYHEGKPPSGAFEVMERHSGKGNVSVACLPHHSSHGTFWVVHLLRKRRSQNLKLHNEQKFTSDVCLKACTCFWKLSRGSIQISISSSLI